MREDIGVLSGLCVKWLPAFEKANPLFATYPYQTLPT